MTMHRPLLYIGSINVNRIIISYEQKSKLWVINLLLKPVCIGFL